MVETSIVPGRGRAVRQARRRLVGPRRRLGDAAQAQSGAPQIFRDQIDQHWQCDECSRTPLEGKTALDVGCGAGLLAEPLARLGAKVTGIDAVAGNDRGRARPCRGAGLEIDYRAGDVQELEGQFDLVTSHGGDRACRRPGGVRESACAAARAGRPADPVDAQRDRLVEADDDHDRRRARPDPQGHARFRQVHRARSDEAAACAMRASNASMSKALPGRRRAGFISATTCG